MKMKIPKGRAARGVVLASLASLGLLMSAPPAFGFGGILSDFNSTYPGSSSGSNAGCQLCHGNSTSTWNEYGWGLRQNGENFVALEGLPSVNINGGTAMLDEINASTQPGWTTGANNNLYNSGGLTSSTATAPGGIGTLDPAAANQPPVADPNGPYTGVVGVNVMFDGTGSSDPDGTIASYSWDFGDGAAGTGASPQHAYAVAATYTVTLTVTDNDGATSDPVSTTATIDAANQVPTADPNGPYSGTVNAPVTFDGSGSTDPDGTIVAYDWDFGDGNTGTGLSPTHTYTASRDYTVSLTVTDDAGATDTATTTATIGEGNQPPVADANGPYSGTAGVPVDFDGSGSSDPDGSIVAYDWDFGDGNTGTGVAPTNTYAAAGTYNVTLTVTDDAGATDSATSTANIGDAPQAPIADPNGPYSGTPGVPVTFDGSGSSDPDGGAITAYDWDFGDGNTGTGVSPTHTYASEGTYTVTLTVVDDEGASSAPATTTADIGDVANQPPTADPNGPYSGAVSVNVMFDGTGSSDPDGTIASYDWDFGDGSTGTGASPQHAYAGVGTYTVTLTVTDDLGAVSDPATTTATIVEGNQPPVSDPIGPYSGTVGMPVTFDGSGSTDPDGTIVAYDWDFGDGSTGTGVSPNHMYAASGAFTVSLTVTDDAGDSNTATTTATIGEGNLPPVADPNGPYSAEFGVQITFDGTGSTDPDGTIVSYDWDFGDGTVELDAGPTPSHIYAAEGTYNVTLTVTDDADAMDSGGTTATVGVADVYLSRVKAPKALKLKKGQVLKTIVTARGDGTQLTQEATVTLSAKASRGIGVVIKPAAITEEVKPGRRDTRFRFTVFLSCKDQRKGSGTVDWTAMIDAPANADASNDVQTGTTSVQCGGRKGRDEDDDHDDHDDHEHDHD